LKHTYLIKVTPVFKNSTECTNEEFDGIIPHMKDQKLAIVAQAKANQTPIIKFLKERRLIIDKHVIGFIVGYLAALMLASILFMVATLKVY
jgi:hypothetical protein